MSNKKYRNKPIETNEELDIDHSLDDIETADTEMTENSESESIDSESELELELESESEPEPVVVTEEDQPVEIVYGFVNVPSLHVRAEPTANAQSIKVLKEATRVVIEDVIGDWYRVHPENAPSVKGFCMKEFITREG